MKILDTFWFTQMSSDPLFGIVVGLDEHTDEIKAYIGKACGDTEKLDSQRIAQNGSKINLRELYSFLDKYSPGEKGKS